LDTNCGVALRVKTGWPAEDFSGDLVLLKGDAGVVERMLGKIAEQPTQRFRAAETMTIGKFIYLLEALLPAKREAVCQCHLTET